MFGTSHTRLLAGTALFCLILSAPSQAQFAAGIDLTTLNGSDGFRISGGGFSGSSVSSAGDVNGDGFADFLIGAPGASPHGSQSGASYVVFGKAQGFGANLDLSTLDGSNGFQISGEAAEDGSGRSVSSAGDVNGDGFSDVIIGADSADPHGDHSGASYVVFGKATGFGASIDLSTLDGSSGFRISGEGAIDFSGGSVSGAGDVNGDGFADLLIGAFRASPHGEFSGASYVVFGKAKGFGANIDLSALNGSNGFQISGEQALNYSGYSVSGAGDVNGDGFADVLIGAFGAEPHGERSGASYVVFGKASGFGANVDLSSLNGSNGFQISGEAYRDYSGKSVSSAGDVNGDGFADLLIGASGAVAPGTAYGDYGASYVVFGKASGFAANINLSSLNGSNGFQIVGEVGYDYAGVSVSGAGDVNGDGFADLLIGAARGFRHLYETFYSATSFVVFGKESGFGANLELASLDGSDGFEMYGASPDGRTPTNVSSAGDVNGDGFADVLAGVWSMNTSYVLFGRKPNVAVTRTGSAGRQIIQGGSLKDTLKAVGKGDVLEGRGGGDTLSGDLVLTTASYAHAPSGLLVNLEAPQNSTGHAKGDSFSKITGLEGSAFGDSLVGNSQANVLTGGKGKDTLKGGGGKDVFRFRSTKESPSGSPDVILDFNPNAADIIDLSAIDAKAALGGNQAFSFIGTGPFSKPGQVRVVKSGTAILVESNTSGTSGAELAIELNGLSDLAAFSAADFKL